MTSGSPLFGTTLVLPRTKAERESKQDPRRAIEERYASKDDVPVARCGRPRATW